MNEIDSPCLIVVKDTNNNVSKKKKKIVRGDPYKKKK